MAIKKRLFILLIYIAPLNLLAQFVNPGLILTFDDNSIESWHKLLPIFKKYNAKATFFICNPYAFDSVQKQMILDLHAAGNEIASHGYYHYNSVNFTDTSSIDSYIATEIIPSINWFDSILNIKVTSFAYPYGARSNRLDFELLKYFKIIRGTNYSILSSDDKISKLSNSKSTSGLGIDESYGHSLSDIKRNIDQCMNDNLIQIFYSHRPTDSANEKYQISYSTIDSILRYASEIGMSFYTISDACLPIPPVPIGDYKITEDNTFSRYYTEKNDHDIFWSLLPSKSGTLVCMDSVVLINWNLDYVGPVMLKAAYKNICGQGDFSTLNINHKVLSSNINIFPNPSKGEITIFVVGNSVKKIDVFNTAGQVVYSVANSEEFFKIDLADKGFYIVRVINENLIESKSFVLL